MVHCFFPLNFLMCLDSVPKCRVMLLRYQKPYLQRLMVMYG